MLKKRIPAKECKVLRGNVADAGGVGFPRSATTATVFLANFYKKIILPRNDV